MFILLVAITIGAQGLRMNSPFGDGSMPKLFDEYSRFYSPFDKEYGLETLQEQRSTKPIHDLKPDKDKYCEERYPS